MNNTEAAITKAAKLAAASSLDAHGLLVQTAEAWDFITGMMYDEDTDTFDMLPEGMPDLFRVEYEKEGERLQREIR